MQVSMYISLYIQLTCLFLTFKFFSLLEAKSRGVQNSRKRKHEKLEGKEDNGIDHEIKKVCAKIFLVF